MVFSFQDDKKYTAQVVNAIDFKQVYRYFSEFQIIFNCRPFKYAVENNIETINTSGAKVTNSGTIESEPVINIYGRGDIKLKINDDEITIKNVDEYVTINSVLKDAYKDEVLKNGDMIGEFPLFKVGENIISFSGNVSKIEVEINEAWI